MNIFKSLVRNLSFMLFMLVSACGPLPVTQTTIMILPTSTEEGGLRTVNTDTPMPMKTENSFSTLAVDLQDQLYEYLRNNRNCELPCFLGITPGETSWTDARLFLETYSTNRPIEPDKSASSQDYTVYFAQMQTSTDISLMMRLRLKVGANGLVQHINFDATSSRDGSFVGDDQHLSRYSLRELFREHGSPDSIYMKPIKRGVYSIHVVYDELKMVIALTGQAKKGPGGDYSVCPNLGEGNPLSLTIALANSSDSIDVESLLDYPFHESELPLEDATGLNPDEFYALMSSDETPACFDVQ